MIGILALVMKVFACVWGLGRYAGIFLWSCFRSRSSAAARIVALESQLDVYLRRSEPKRVGRFSDAFRFLWILLSKWWEGWERVCHAMKPRTVVSWHQKVFKRFWIRLSRSELGRKRTLLELRKLIRQISRENPLWGAKKIRDVLVDLGFAKLDIQTVRKYMVRRRHPRNPSGNWLTFIRNHLEVSWAIDFCVVRTIGFRALYVFVVLEHGRRRIRHWAVTQYPSLDWIIQQLREATPFGERPRYLHRDNDGLYGKRVSKFLRDSGIQEVKSAYRSPWQNPFVERFFGSLRRELLEHVIIFHEAHLRLLIGEYVGWYEHARPHQGLGGECPVPRKGGKLGEMEAKTVSIPVLGGLQHCYERIAA
jgi:transposase InsO family protein